MKKILLIEDNREMRENTSEILELAGYKVLTAENGKIGVELAQKNLPDLIVCDIMRPVLDGYGVLHLLSKNEDTANIPFIFLSAKAERSALTWRVSFGLGGSHDFALRYSNPTGTARDVEFRVNAPDGSVIDLRVVRLPPSGATSAEVRVSGVGMNAGDYTVTVAPIAAPLVVEALRFN